MSGGVVAIATGFGTGRMAPADSGIEAIADPEGGPGEVAPGPDGPATGFVTGMIDRLPILIALVHGPAHRCVLANAAVRALAGDAPIIGTAIDQLFAGSARGDLLALLERARAAAGGVRGTVPLDGEPVGADLECIPLTVAGDASVLIVGRDAAAAGELATWKALPPTELGHRVNNTIAAARTVAERTARSASSVEEFLEQFQARLEALDTVQRLFAADGWRRLSGAALVAALVEPYANGDGRILLDIDEVSLRSEAALTLALVISELATNAARHGALSTPGGRVSVTGRLERDNGNDALGLTWQEEGGPPVRAPERSGFGTTMLSRAVEHQHGGQADLDWREEGVVYQLRLPLI